MPTFTAFAPALASARAPSAVATLPATISALGKVLRISATASSTNLEWPCAVSTQITSHPACSSEATRACRSELVLTAAPTRKRPRSSLAAYGCCCAFSMSLMVMSPRNLPAWSTTSNFSIRFLCRSSFEPSRLMPSGAVMRLVVITSRTGWSRLRSNRTSRLVRIPTGLPSRPTTGRPEISVSPHQFQGREQFLIRIDGDRVDDHPGLGLLHLGDLERLFFDGHVLVDDAEPPLARHADGRRGLGHGVHRGRQDGNGKGDVRGQVRADIHVLGGDLALGGHEQDIVEREGFAQGTVGQHLGRLYICGARFKSFTRDGWKIARQDSWRPPQLSARRENRADCFVE